VRRLLVLVDAGLGEGRELTRLRKAWREANPDLDEETDLPAEIRALEAKHEAMTAVADGLTERVVNWIPDSIADAIRMRQLIRRDRRDGSPSAPRLAIPGTGRGCADRQSPAPRQQGCRWRAGFGDRRRNNRHTCRQRDRAGGQGVSSGLLQRLCRSDHSSGAGELVSSVFILSALADIAGLVPELAPLCAPALAEEGAQPRPACPASSRPPLHADHRAGREQLWRPGPRR
jgi:hypothetical protein